MPEVKNPLPWTAFPYYIHPECWVGGSAFRSTAYCLWNRRTRPDRLWFIQGLIDLYRQPFLVSVPDFQSYCRINAVELFIIPQMAFPVKSGIMWLPKANGRVFGYQLLQGLDHGYIVFTIASLSASYTRPKSENIRFRQEFSFCSSFSFLPHWLPSLHKVGSIYNKWWGLPPSPGRFPVVFWFPREP